MSVYETAPDSFLNLNDILSDFTQYTLARYSFFHKLPFTELQINKHFEQNFEKIHDCEFEGFLLGFIKALSKLYQGFIKALSRLFKGFIKALSRLYQASIKALSRLFQGIS